MCPFRTNPLFTKSILAKTTCFKKTPMKASFLLTLFQVLFLPYPLEILKVQKTHLLQSSTLDASQSQTVFSCNMSKNASINHFKTN